MDPGAGWPNCHNPCASHQQQERHCQACILGTVIFFFPTFPCALSSVPPVQPIGQFHVWMAAGGRLRVTKFLQLQESEQALCLFPVPKLSQLSQLSTLGEKAPIPVLADNRTRGSGSSGNQAWQFSSRIFHTVNQIFSHNEERLFCCKLGGLGRKNGKY